MDPCPATFCHLFVFSDAAPGSGSSKSWIPVLLIIFLLFLMPPQADVVVSHGFLSCNILSSSLLSLMPPQAAGAQHNVVNIHTSSFSALNLLIHCM